MWLSPVKPHCLFSLGMYTCSLLNTIYLWLSSYLLFSLMPYYKSGPNEFFQTTGPCCLWCRACLTSNQACHQHTKRGWTVQIRITNPAHELVTKEFLDATHAQTERGELPVDAIIIAPATFNTINKLSGGISDECHLDFLHPRIMRVRTVILPFVNKGYADWAVYKTSLERLRNEGVSIMELKPHDLGKGGAEVDHFPWDAGLDEIDNLMSRRGRG